jgi:DNA polymerase-3 subunit gamma/tau
MGDSPDIFGDHADTTPTASELEEAGQGAMFGAPEPAPAPVAAPAPPQRNPIAFWRANTGRAPLPS